MGRTPKMKIIDILRLSELGLSQQKIADSAGCGRSTVGDLLRLCRECGIDHATAASLTEEQLHERLYPESAMAIA